MTIMTNDLVDQTSYDDDAAVAYDALRYDDEIPLKNSSVSES